MNSRARWLTWNERSTGILNALNPVLCRGGPHSSLRLHLSTSPTALRNQVPVAPKSLDKLSVPDEVDQGSWRQAEDRAKAVLRGDPVWEALNATGKQYCIFCRAMEE